MEGAMSWFAFRPYVSVAQRRAKASQLTAKLRKQGRTITPITIAGRAIATTFWGKAWCDHLESYSDYANRLPRGRTYVRNGSVIDLQIGPGKITAMVSGSNIYHITIKIAKLSSQRWKTVKAQCAGKVGSVLELLQGRFAKSVMTILTDRDKGLFPAPAEISMQCSCPDWAGMCKHLAAVLYGIGSRLDHQPELLFVLREVDHLELIEQAATAGSLGSTGAGRPKTLKDNELADIFGIELEPTAASLRPAEKAARAGRKRLSSKGTAQPATSVNAKGAGNGSSTPPARTTRKAKTPAAEARVSAVKGRKAPTEPKRPRGRRLPL
jgi:uncharacterized Zn finger protein